MALSQYAIVVREGRVRRLVCSSCPAYVFLRGHLERRLGCGSCKQGVLR
jgi:ribosomal protein S27AE